MKKKILRNFFRNCKFCTAALAAVWYKSLIPSNLEYCASTLFTCTSQVMGEIIKIEKALLKSSHSSIERQSLRKLFILLNILK